MIYRSSFRKKKIYFHVAVQVSGKHLNSNQIDTLWADLAKRIQRHHFLTPHSCVLMSNHFHGIFEIPEIYFEMAEAALKAEFSQIQEYPLNCEDGGSFRLIRINCFAAYREIYRYIYRNPLEAGLCVRAELYPYSSLAELIGLRQSLHGVADAMGVITNPFQVLDWINQKPQSEDCSLH